MSEFISVGIGQGIEWLFPISLTGTVGTHNSSILTLPANFRLVRAEFRITTTLVGGTAQVALGVASAGETIITPQNVDVAETLIGDLTAQLGTDMLSTRSYEAFYPTVSSIWLKRIIAGSTITAGAANLYIAGYIL